MRYCDKCQVQIVGRREVCPLCQGPVTRLDDDDSEIFPFVPTIYHQYNLLFRALIFASVVVGVLAIVVNMLVPSHFGWWSFFVLAGIGCFWLVLVVAVRKRANVLKNMLYQTVLWAGLVLLWDFITGWRGWSLNFAVPILFYVSLTAMIILTKVLLRGQLSEQLVYLCINLLLNFVPLIFLAAGVLHVRWPSIICVATAVVTLAAVLLFMDRSLKRELRRRLHL